MKKYIALSMLLITPILLFGKEKPTKNGSQEPVLAWIIKEDDVAARSNYVETFADAFRDPNILIGVFEWPAEAPHRTILSSGEILEDMLGYSEAMNRFDLIKFNCIKTIKGKPPEPVVLVPVLLPPMLEARPRIPSFVPLLGSKWVLALQKTSKEYRIYRFGGEEIEKYRFINDRTIFRVFRYGHGALCLKWADYKKMVPKFPESPEPSHLVKVPEGIVDDFEAIQRVVTYTQKENMEPHELAAITRCSKALKTDVAKSIFAKLLADSSHKGHDPNHR